MTSPHQRNVLIVDDDNVSRNLYSRMLEQLNYKVTTADGGNQAIHCLHQNPNFQLLLVDVLMPDIDGIELLRIFKQATSQEIPIIMISSSEDPDTIAQCFQSGAADFLQKPINFEMLKKRVEVCEVLQKERENRKFLANTVEEQKKELEKIKERISHEVETPIQVVMKAISELIEGTHSEQQYKGALIAILKSLVSKDLYKPTFSSLMEQGMDNNTLRWLETEYMHDETQQDKKFGTPKIEKMIENAHALHKRQSVTSLATPVPLEIKKTIFELEDFKFDVFKYTADELVENCAYMFVKLGLIDRFNIDTKKLGTFLKIIRKKYNDNPYHNFVHAMDVTQFVYATISSVDKISELLGPIDLLSMLVAAICHDVDHPGLTNTFQINAKSQLSLLYNDISILENHHCYVAFTTLFDADCNFLENLSNEEFKEFRSTTISLILSTDMANHFTTVAKFQTRLQTGTLSSENKEDRQLLMNTVLKCADVSNAARPFFVAKQWANELIDEFLKQGDLEKQRGFVVSPMMDRDTLDKVQMQINFIDFIAGPLYKALAQYAPAVNTLVNTIQTNRAKWTSYIGKSLEDQQILDSANPSSPSPREITSTPNYEVKDAIEGGLGTEVIARVKGFKVLSIEAHENSQKILNDLMPKAGYDSIVVPHISEAVAFMREEPVLPEVVVVDFYQQSTQPEQIAEQIQSIAQEQSKYISILGLTDSDEHLTVQGYDVILTKPAHAKEFMLAIEKCLEMYLNTVPCVDMTLALEQTGADEEFIVELLAVLIEDGRKQAATMHRSLDELSWSDLILQAHSMKGAAAQLACKPLSQAAFILERAAKNREVDVLQPALEQLDNRLAELEEFVRDQLH